MTDERMALQALLEKTPDADFLRQMIGLTAQRLMELDIESRTGAARGERSNERLAQRNGYRDRDWETRAGTVELRIPKLRKGSYFPAFEPRRMAEKAIDRGHAGGLHSRRLDPLGRRSGSGHGDGRAFPRARSAGFARRSTKRSKAFLGRPIEGDWPYVWLDATYVKVRRERAHRLGGGDHRDRRQRRRPPRGAGHGYRRRQKPRRSGASSCANWRGAGCAGSSSSSRTPTKASRPLPPRCWRLLAALPRPLHAQRAGARRQERPPRRFGLHRHRLRPGRRRGGAARSGARSPISCAPSCQSSQRCIDEAETDVLAYMSFPSSTPDQAALDESDRAAQRRNQAPHRGGRHLPQRRLPSSVSSAHPDGAKRRMGRPTSPLHDAGNHRTDQR